ncbi:MAG TPA: PAS domain-containing protein [Solirubrobacteraceae bacterium]|nr:PAS domain-containing protein [Solirubrobacteraceae bacterium]
MPAAHDAFLVVDSALCVQAMSSRAQELLGIGEELAINRPVSELLMAADAEGSAGSFAAKIVQAAAGEEGGMARSFVRPWNTFGVRLRARIATCGPPRAALVVLEGLRPPEQRRLRAVS